MKVAGIILLVLQVLAIVGGGLPIGNGLAYSLGFFLPTIIGVTLLVKAGKKKEKKDKDGQQA